MARIVERSSSLLINYVPSHYFQMICVLVVTQTVSTSFLNIEVNTWKKDGKVAIWPLGYWSDHWGTAHWGLSDDSCCTTRHLCTLQHSPLLHWDRYLCLLLKIAFHCVGLPSCHQLSLSILQHWACSWYSGYQQWSGCNVHTCDGLQSQKGRFSGKPLVLLLSDS